MSNIGLFLEGLTQLLGQSGYIAEVTNEGKLKVEATILTTPPAGKTLVVGNAYNAITATTDTYYVIPNGATLVINYLEGGGVPSTQGSGVGLYYQPNGNATGEVMITVPIISNGVHYQKTIEWTCPSVGDGTRRIALRRIRYDSVSRFVSAEWRGYY